MAPIAIEDEPTANKRKRDVDEHSKRKRAKRDRHLSTSVASNGSLPNETPPNQDIRSIAPRDGSEDMTTAVVNAGAQAPKKKKRHHRSKEKEEHDQLLEDHQSTWRISQPMGGRMLNIDPIFTEDEKHLILAYNTSIQVYSATESLLIRKIQLPLLAEKSSLAQVVSIVLSPTSPNLVWVASSTGHLWLIDWTKGDGFRLSLRLSCDLVHDMSVESMKIGRESRDVPLLSIKRDENWHIVACDIEKSKLKRSKDILTQTMIIRNLRSIQNGYALTASAEHNVILGTLRTPAIASFHDLDYEFFTLDCADDITCLDIRATERIHLNRKSQVEAGDEPVVEIAVGCARGAVFFYNDLLPQLRWLHGSKSRKYSLQPRKYHWHRRAVHAVKWSRDGNYIISGGSESTLVLWQLDTQKMDFLPHLSASVENIVVSTRGSAYVLHLDDNSVMVLSTAEMKPTTYVSGIQTLLFPQPFSKDDMVKRVGQYSTTRLCRTPAAVSPSDTSRILLCVGSGQRTSNSGSGPSTPLIQTLDLTTMQSISKQALTRTNPTDVNMTAKGYTVTEPRITGIAYSADGKWLATTDEWQPPARDVNTLQGLSVERREVYLKFWAVSSEDQSLELVSRINAPHYTGRSEEIFDLAADPKSHRFATIGEDGVIRFWESTVRQRDGVPVKGKLGRQLHSWACSRVIYLQEHESPVDQDARAAIGCTRGSGAVAFSEDGSALVCAIATSYGSAVYIIDTESGKIRNSVDGLIKGDIRDIRILSSCLVVLSDHLIVYDLVLDEMRYGVQLRPSEDLHHPGASILTHMAADYQTSTYAIAVTRSKPDSTHFLSEFAVFTPDQSEPQLVQRFPHPITSVIPSIGSSGYLVLDSAAQLWSVSEGMATKTLAFAQPLADLDLHHEEETTSSREAEAPVALLTEDDAESVSGDEMDVDNMPDNDTDGDGAYPAVIAPQKLAELFDAAPAFAMPPIEDMFYQVTKLFLSNTATPTA
ncbi:sporulation protein [Xylariaceae sp. FL0662B]|nr:sporulation protein [Xylariaceae sp. FL0662B]